MSDERLYISDVSEILNRQPNTIRGWERDGVLPSELRAKRDQNGWRFWLPWQIDQIKIWITLSQRYPGKGLSNYNPTSDDVESHVQNVRKARRERVTESDSE